MRYRVTPVLGEWLLISDERDKRTFVLGKGHVKTLRKKYPDVYEALMEIMREKKEAVLEFE